MTDIPYRSIDDVGRGARVQQGENLTYIQHLQVFAVRNPSPAAALVRPQVEAALLASGLQELSEIPVDVIPSPAPLPTGSRIPISANPMFVGRERELRKLAAMLKPDGAVIAVALIGIGGMGKTQTAAEFAHRYGRYFSGGVYWVSLADPTSVAAEIAACGESGAFDVAANFGSLTPEDRVKTVMRAWQDGCRASSSSIIARMRRCSCTGGNNGPSPRAADLP
jgi:hypothetical protein